MITFEIIVSYVHLLHVEIYTLDDTVKMSYLSGQFFFSKFRVAQFCLII